jgi:FkbM family methyltransferase
MAALSNPEGRVYAFEPLQATFDRLAINIELNGLTNVEAHNVAVGNDDGSVQLVQPVIDDIPSSASLSRRFMETTGLGLITSTVKSVRLHSLIPERSYPERDLVKLDTARNWLFVRERTADQLAGVL